MKTTFSTSWKSSKQPRKQRKYVYHAPKHIRNKLVSATLSKTLKEKYNKKNVPLRKGDKVKVLRGQFKGKAGEVSEVNLSKLRAYITNVEIIKKDGTKVPYPIHPSKLMITELKVADKKRKKLLEKKQDGKEPHKKINSTKDLANKQKKQ